MVFAISSFAIQAQEFSVNAGTFINSFSEHAVDSAEDQRFIGSVEFAGDFFGKSKFRFGPVIKTYFYDGNLGDAINDSSKNDYAFSGGLEAGIDFSDSVSFAVGYELPLPDHRNSIFEAVVSPSLILAQKGGLGLKLNFDYFINKKLHEHHMSFGGGLIYKF